MQGRKRILLYTERAHFYFRYRISGIKVCAVHLVWLCCAPVSWPQRTESMAYSISLPSCTTLVIEGCAPHCYGSTSTAS